MYMDYASVFAVQGHILLVLKGIKSSLSDSSYHVLATQNALLLSSALLNPFHYL